MRLFRSLIAPLLGCPVLLQGAAAPVKYEAAVAPLFQEHCVDCHAADDPDGGFALDTFEALMEGGKGGKALEAGNAQDSLLVKFLEGRSGKEGKNRFMPPGKRDPLKAEEIAIIRRWIDQGALPPSSAASSPGLLAGLPKIAPTVPPPLAVQTLAYSPRAGLVAAGSYGIVRLLEPGSLAERRRLSGIEGKVNAVAFSADGTHLFAAAGDAGVSGVAYQWKVADGTLVRKFEGHSDTLYTLAISPDGKFLATGSYDQKIKLWPLQEAGEPRTLTGHNGAVFGLAFRPDSKLLASASADRTVKLWQVPSGARLDTFSQPLKEQSIVVFSPDGKLIAAGGLDNRVRLWEVSGSGEEGSNQLRVTKFAHEGAVLNLSFSGDGRRLVSTASDRTAKVWEVQGLAELHLLEAQPDWAPAVTMVEEGKVLLGRLDGSLGRYVLGTGKREPVAAPKPAAAKKAPAKPELSRLTPRGVQAGAAARLTLTGKHLADIREVIVGHAGITAKVVSVNPSGTSAVVEVLAAAEVPRTEVDFSIKTAAGTTPGLKLSVDYLPQATGEPGVLAKLPVNAWGTLLKPGQVDRWRFEAREGETLVFDLAARRIGSKALSPRLEIMDAGGRLLEGNNGLDSGSDPFIAFTAPRSGKYEVLVREVTLAGSADHAYRLTVGALPYVTGWWPLSVPPNQESHVHLVGHNLTERVVKVAAPADGQVPLPLDTKTYRSRVAMTVAVSAQPEVLEEEEGRDALEAAQSLTWPVSVNGRLYVKEAKPGAADVDHYRFEAKKGQQLVVETRAAMMGAPTDTKLEILDAAGQSVPMMQLQATKDSWITLRSEDANDAAIRLGQFDEMELNDYMYFNGEVLKIYRLARGPDADMIFYAGDGKRLAYFNTSPAAHGLDDACYVVEPRMPGEKILPNGLPVFTLNHANDDDGSRELGRDSRIHFTAPADGVYHVRVSDTRGWGGERFAYRLILREPRPGFVPRLKVPAALKVPQGSGVQFAVSVEREDNYEGPVEVEITGVPAGFYVSTPLRIEKGHLDAAGTLYALPGTKGGEHDFSQVKLRAKGLVGDAESVQDLASFPKVTVEAPLKRSLFMEPDAAGRPAGDGKTAPAQPYEITIEPGGRIPVWLRMDRRGDDALVGVDVENLPHGVIIDSIGLNGVQIRAGESEREIFLSCAPWVEAQDRLCHIVVGSARNDAVRADGAQTSFPVLLKVRKKADSAVAEK